MMNTTTTIDKATNNQNAFNYAVYMMLGSYFKQMEAVSECYVQKLYLYYVENKRERQYSFEDIAIRFVERVCRSNCQRRSGRNGCWYRSLRGTAGTMLPFREPVTHWLCKTTTVEHARSCSISCMKIRLLSRDSGVWKG